MRNQRRAGGRERHERRPRRDALEPARGGADVVDRDEAGVGRHAHQRRPAVRWQSMQSAAHGIASSRSGAIGRPQLDTGAERALVEPRQRRVDLGEVLLVAVAEREVALLLEDLGRGGGLGAVRHRAGRDDALGEPRAQPVALGLERRSRIGRRRGVGRHRRIVRPFGSGRSSRPAISSPEHARRSPEPWPSRSIPSAAWRSRPTPRDLKLEHDGTTYWFCGKGCLLEFRTIPRSTSTRATNRRCDGTRREAAV